MTDDEAFARLRATDPAAGSEPDVAALRARVTALVGDVAGPAGGGDLELRLRVARLLVEDGAGEPEAAAAAAILGGAALPTSAPGTSPDVASPEAATPRGEVPGGAATGSGATGDDARVLPLVAPDDARARRRRLRTRWVGVAAAAVLVVGGGVAVVADRLGGLGASRASLDTARATTAAQAAEDLGPLMYDAGGFVLASHPVTPEDEQWSRGTTVRALALEPVTVSRARVAAVAGALGMAGRPVHAGETWTVSDDNGVLRVEGTSVSYESSRASTGVLTSEDAPDTLALLVRVVGATGLDVDSMSFTVAPDGTAAWTEPRAPGGADADVQGVGDVVVDQWGMKVDDMGVVSLGGSLLRRTTADVGVRAVTDVLGREEEGAVVTFELVLVADGAAWVPEATYVVTGPRGYVSHPAS
ncbi:hypothetical protein [Sanguibacter sp. HDW7]|uniref:hypothetical protein n=1 Tax=Sanguibacter sp. HDW7 TaxID=2714931 RepID=UPI00140C8D69|nr:hypothetical protein [Sanguibacter sp. HDW7]QIK84418.1 hypothetical protein G7063_12930 [Sanguibacter sp. HDW7]